MGASQTDYVGDIINGAQLGFGPNLPQIDGATPLTLMPIIVIVTRTPSMFSGIDNAEALLKAMIERYAKEITGIDFGYTLAGQPQPVGQDGQEMHMPTDSKRTSVAPSITYPEAVGNIIWNFHRNWIWMIKQPDTQASILAAMTGNNTLLPQQFSSFTMDICCIQFDSTMLPSNIVDAWFITNMWPQETGMFGAKKQIGHTEMPDRTISYYGIVQHNTNTKIAGINIANQLNLHQVNYDFSTPVDQSFDPTTSTGGLYESTSEAIAAYTDPNGTTPSGSTTTA
ncbi:unnamed protein product [Sphagnum jensenii]|uniref:Capsid protein n=1 Tax=Sphagnum jensenii TaxID=128206 RepID=A0ABP0VIA9_9BRYO